MTLGGGIMSKALLFRSLTKRPLYFNEINNELQRKNFDSQLSRHITIFPQENPNTGVIEEDSDERICYTT